MGSKVKYNKKFIMLWYPDSEISKYDLSMLNYGEPLEDGITLGEIDSFDFYIKSEDSSTPKLFTR